MIRKLLPVLAFTAALAACNGNPLAPAQAANVVDTLTLGALAGTPLHVASALSISDRRVVRTDQTASFDLAYDVSPTLGPVFRTAADLGAAARTGASPGLMLTTKTFDEITIAELNGYAITGPVPVQVGQVYYVRSSVVCVFIGSPVYGKMEVLALDEANRTVTLRILVNTNCGYRGLQPGVPSS
ncbi:MAG: hypothetical protein ACOY71_05575 [Gemmatimonadota bacterium]